MRGRTAIRKSGHQPLDYAADAASRMAGVRLWLPAALQRTLRHVGCGVARPMKNRNLGRRGAALIVLIGAAAVLCGVAGVARWRTLQALRQSAAQLAAEQKLEFTLLPLEQRASRFQPVS